MEKPTSSNVYEIDMRPFGSHAKIAAAVGKRASVLDIGSGPGLLARELEAAGCVVVCVESDKTSADLAKSRCSRVIETDIETMDRLPEDIGRFDCILFADVLEHTRNPELILGRMMSYLKENGHIIVTLPNIAQIWVRISLLFGRFNYRDRGVLDRAHLRFYTFDTARTLISSCGYEILRTDFTIHPFWKPWIAPVIYRLTKTFPALLAVQFLFEARPRRIS
jgi:SAM-dependent methyltransferase